MSTTIDFASLDLRAAFDLAILIEEDAQLRYEELVRRIGDDAQGTGAVFRAMAVSERQHRTLLVERRAHLFRNAPPRIELSALDEEIEGADLDGELPGSPREALEAAIAGEHRAHDFFARALPFVADPEVRAFFEQLRDEEVEHAAALEAKLAELGPAPLPRSLPARPEPPPPQPVPDRAELTAILPQFDAATQAIAGGVLVEGLGPHQVAAALGVSPRIVKRTWARFLDVARHRIALGLAAATLAGCAGPLPQGPAPRPAEVIPREAPFARALPDRSDPQPLPDESSAVAARVHAEITRRMPGHAAQVRARVARAVLAEATLAKLDPLLVVALIHVESSFDPDVVSDAGAVGLMQLREPTMRRELERSGLAPSDPRDPVMNVRAGVRYLRRLVDAFGVVDVALMAYNAGPNRIRGHLRSGAIPDRFHTYPRRVKSEFERLRVSPQHRQRPVLARGAPGGSATG